MKCVRACVCGVFANASFRAFMCFLVCVRLIVHEYVLLRARMHASVYVCDCVCGNMYIRVCIPVFVSAYMYVNL